MENAAVALAWHARVESYIENYALADSLCRRAVDMSKESASMIDQCARAFRGKAESAKAEEMAAKLDRLRPEGTTAFYFCAFVLWPYSGADSYGNSLNDWHSSLSRVNE